MITADAMHTQRDHAVFLVDKQAHYILVVKKNQPGLYAQVKNLPRRHVAARPPALPGPRPRGAPHHQGHRRRGGIAFPYAAQAIRLTHRIQSASWAGVAWTASRLVIA